LLKVARQCSPQVLKIHATACKYIEAAKYIEEKDLDDARSGYRLEIRAMTSH